MIIIVLISKCVFFSVMIFVKLNMLIRFNLTGISCLFTEAKSSEKVILCHTSSGNILAEGGKKGAVEEAMKVLPSTSLQTDDNKEFRLSKVLSD